MAMTDDESRVINLTPPPLVEPAQTRPQVAPATPTSAATKPGTAVRLYKAPEQIDLAAFQVEVGRSRRVLRALGIADSSVSPRWQLNGELAQFVIENPNMTEQEHALVAYAHEVESADLDTAWTAFNAAQRLVLGRAGDDEIIARTSALRVEVETQLTGWRQEAARAVLGPDDPNSVPTTHAVVQTQRLIDEYNDHRYRQMATHGRSLRFIGLLVSGLLIAFGIVVGFEWISFPTDDGPSIFASLGSYLAVVVLGAMGALLSVFMSRIGGPDANPHTDLSNRVAGYVRPVLGALSAIVVVLVLESGVQNIISLGDNGIFVAALLAGFSERLIDRALGGIAD